MELCTNKKGVNNMEITISELLQSNLIKPSTKDSIIKAGKMRDNVKKSVIRQLQHSHETVEYVAGKRGQEPRFILGNPREVESEYNQYENVGGKSIDWSEIDNYIENRMGYMMIVEERKGNKYEHYVTKRRIIERLTKEDKIVKALVRIFINNDNIESLQQVRNMYSDNENWNLNRMMYDLAKMKDYLDYFVESRITTSLLNRVDVVLAKHEHSVKYISEKDGKYIQITEEEYNKYTKFKKEQKENNPRITVKQMNKLVEEKFPFEYAFVTYFVHNAEELKNDNYDFVEITNFLYSRVIQSAERKQSKSEFVDDDKAGVDILNVRLLKNGNFVEFMELFFKEMFDENSKNNEAVSNFIEDITSYEEEINRMIELNGGKLNKEDKARLYQINLLKKVA